MPLYDGDAPTVYPHLFKELRVPVRRSPEGGYMYDSLATLCVADDGSLRCHGPYAVANEQQAPWVPGPNVVQRFAADPALFDCTGSHGGLMRRLRGARAAS